MKAWIIKAENKYGDICIVKSIAYSDESDAERDVKQTQARETNELIWSHELIDVKGRCRYEI